MNPDKALKLLNNGYAVEFSTVIVDHPRYRELIKDLAIQFVEKEIPLQSELHKYKLANMLTKTILSGKF